MNMRTWGRLVIVTLAAAVIQVGVLNGIVVDGAHPDLFLLLAISAGLAGGPQRGAVMGFALGLVADLFVQTPYGLSSLCYVLVAFGVGLAAGIPSGRAPLGFQLATALVGGIGGTLLYAGLGTLIGQPSVPHHQLATGCSSGRSRSRRACTTTPPPSSAGAHGEWSRRGGARAARRHR
jgi:rod shape-determining protein MreD